MEADITIHVPLRPDNVDVTAIIEKDTMKTMYLR